MNRKKNTEEMEVIKLSQKLIEISSISDQSNLPIANFLAEILNQGFTVELQKNKKANKANLIARFGPKNVEPLMFSGHMDTVPFGQEKLWDTDPLVPVIKNSRLYGRGSVDMKSSIAAMIMAAKPLLKQKFKREFIFGFTFDEEIGLVGAKQLAKSKIINPSYTLIGEPTSLKPIRMHKGHIYLKAICRGKSGHGSDPDSGINAILVGQEVIQIINQFKEELKAYSIPEMTPPYATINIGAAHGGEKANVIPEKFTLLFDIRTIPGQSNSAMISDLKNRLERIGSLDNAPLVTLNTMKIPTSPVLTDKDSRIIQIAEKITQTESRGAP